MYATNFEYAGEKLSDYGMIICTIDKSSGVEIVSSGANITFNQVKPSNSNRFYISSSKYEEPLQTTFHICKNPCNVKNGDKMSISKDEISALQRWLCRKNEYHVFKLDQEDLKNIYWNATFTSQEITYGGETIGLELTVHTDSPFSYMDEVSVEYNCSAGASFSLYDNSDEITDTNHRIHPNMEIVLLSDGCFKLENSMDTKVMKIENCSKDETITIDGKNQIISSSIKSHIAKDFNYFFPQIINTYDERCNTFTPSLDCKIKIAYSPIKKIGL